MYFIPSYAITDVSFQDPFCGFTAQPINAAYYMPGVYNGGYSHEPYGQNAYIDSAYGDVQQYPYYGGYSYTPYYANGQAYHNQAYQTSSQAYPGAYGPYPGASGAYRPYPQPQPSPPRRSRTAPGRAVPPTVRTTATSRKSRGLSADPFEKRQFKAFSGPTKKPSPVYRKSRDPYNYRIAQYQETDFGGAPLDYTSQFQRGYPNEAPTTLRRLRPFYAPSYTTYPPSTMLRTDKKLDTKKYPLYARVAVKAAELILGAAILGLVLGPMRGTSFHDFVIRTNTEWQGAVVGIVATWTIFTAVLLLTSFLANSVHMWRKVDAHVTLIAILAYLLASCLEAYYAACYPPNGPRINLVCHRAEWIIATILCFINTALYVLDFALSWLSGVTML
ncbi:hypothetical protein Y032_0096g2901 [Ancylostoma ceylanicum]|uniref:MARVEL domain-containing protein n=1 Tax=Ancylostoma ceylanicum TaxID=53326 RepID=A0A016TK12_9BILA|nr:hypothetical protein Y032_0096g2901 [Ancylostoma ceylanicum]